MAKNVVSLSVHKNTLERRKRRVLRREMVRTARGIGSKADIAGYVVIGIGKGGVAYAGWDTGKAIPLWALPGFVSEAIRADVNDHMGQHGGSDDYDPDG